jgi:dTDP-4-dehydrorhamnose 3,5-epimerase
LSNVELLLTKLKWNIIKVNVIVTKIPEVLIFEPKVYSDNRGWFLESFNQINFARSLMDLGQNVPIFVQDNHSLSHKGVLRGLHYQVNPNAQGKLVRVIQGRVWDVAVDIRQNSTTFGQWVGVELSADNQKMLWIPEGFAHGFLSLEDNTQYLYKTTNYYSKESERSLVWNDVNLGIDWPIEMGMQLQLADKDQCAPTLRRAADSGNLF